VERTVRGRPTVFNGIMFRSILEARWAVFFSILGVNWIHEPQTFRLQNGKMYLPDYYLSDFKCWLEVKPRDYLDGIAESTLKEAAFQKAWNLSGLGAGDVLLFAGEPRRRNGRHFHWMSTAQGAVVAPCRWFVCDECGVAQTTALSHPNCRCGPSYQNFEHPKLLAAMLLTTRCSFRGGFVDVQHDLED
jgi:hypothetical protein